MYGTVEELEPCTVCGAVAPRMVDIEVVDAGAPLEAKGAGKKPLALAALRAASATSTAQADLANALSELLLAAGAKPPPPPGEEKKGGGKKKK